MSTHKVWPDMDPDEVLVLTFDFTLGMDAGETISIATVSVDLLAGSDPSPSGILDARSISAGKVLQTVSGPIDDATYSLRCAATLTPSGRVLVLAATLPVRTA